MKIKNQLTTILIAMLVVFTLSCNQQPGQNDTSKADSSSTFKGVIKLDVRDSKADWGPYTPKKAPKDAPNILFVLYDDTGLASWSPYGGGSICPPLTGWQRTD